MTHTETQAMCERLRILSRADAHPTAAHTAMEAAALLTRQQEEIERLGRRAAVLSDLSYCNGAHAGLNAANKTEEELADFKAAIERGRQAALQAKPDDGVNETFTLSDQAKPACDSEDPTDMCLHCHCWKFTRSTCR